MTLRATLSIGVMLMCVAPAARARQPVATAADILTTAGLWGDDFGEARPYLSTWAEIDRTVAVFHDRIEGHTPIRNPADAPGISVRLARALERSRALQGRAPESVRFRTAVVTSTDDDFARIAWTGGSLRFLKPNLTIHEVMERLGPPERTTQLLIQGDKDRRPVVLTMRAYAGGTVMFAESDQSPEQGLVDRVLLSVRSMPGDMPPEGGAPLDAIGVPAAAAKTLLRGRATRGAETERSTLVNIATDETDPGNLGDTEPSIAVNPIDPFDIAVVAFSERWSSTMPAPVWKSSDGGTTWRKVFQIPRPGSGSGPGDQKIAFDANGKLYIAELGGGNFIFRQESEDPDDMLVPGAPYGDDQPHLDVDKAAGSPCLGQVYSPWLNFAVTPNQSTISSSSDRGETLTDVAAGDQRFPNRTTRIALAPSGKAYAVYKTREGAVDADFERAHFRVMRSDDCGASWIGLGDGGLSIHGDDQVLTWFTSSWGIPGPGRKVGRARSSDAWIATNATTETVYAVYVNRTEAGFGQIFLARSDDEGTTWTNSQVTDDTHHAAFPEVAVADNGAIGVLYIDYEDTGDATIFRHHFARSFDGGLAWTDEILQAMDPVAIPNAANGFLWGDYEGLTAAGNGFYGVFTGESIGRSASQLDPIFFYRSADMEPTTTASPPSSKLLR